MSLLHKSLKFRKRNLRACIKELKGRLEFTTEFEGKTAQDVRNQMDIIMANRGEGLVMKHPDSTYTLNGRNKDWIKVCIVSSVSYSKAESVWRRSSLSTWYVHRQPPAFLT